MLRRTSLAEKAAWMLTATALWGCGQPFTSVTDEAGESTEGATQVPAGGSEDPSDNLGDRIPFSDPLIQNTDDPAPAAANGGTASQNETLGQDRAATDETATNASTSGTTRPIGDEGSLDDATLEDATLDDGTSDTLDREGNGTSDSPLAGGGLVENFVGDSVSTSDTANGGVDDGANATAGAGEVSSSESRLGRSCDTSEECGAAFDCVSGPDEYWGGSVAGGICTARCEDESAACGEFGLCGVSSQGTAAPGDDIGWCFNRCLYADAQPKCGGDLNRTCFLADQDTGMGVCYPFCYSDGECDTGFCDPASGACVPQLPTGLPDGSVCSEDDDCFGGICYPIAGGSSGVCTSVCSMRNDTFACHRDIGDTSPAGSACFPPLPLLVYGVELGQNDAGQCLPTCDVAVGCEHPDWSCISLQSDFYTADVGHEGLCVPSILLAQP